MIMRKCFVFMMIFLTMVLMGCSNDDTSEETSIADRTILVYIAGDNTLSGFVDDDINEMREGMKSVDATKNKLLVYYDKGSEVKLIRLKKDNGGSIRKEVVREYNARNSVGITEMKEIITYVFSSYPAANYGIIFWSHGEGWLPSSTSTRWFGQDRTNYMEIAELKNVLEAAPSFEFIFFDACFMQSIEVAYELRNFTKYFIGSPAEIPGPGAPYQVVVPAMFSKTNAALNIARNYYNYYAQKYDENKANSNSNWTAGVSISIIDANELELMASETEKIVLNYMEEGVDIDVVGVVCYDNSRTSKRYYYDLVGIIENMTNANEDFKKWLDFYNALVPFYNATDKVYSSTNSAMISMVGSKGVSTYIPRKQFSSLNNYYKSLEWYTAAGWNTTGW
ncbi:MAG: clostripain-related cysteine peptidase [Bacteroides sp.]|nr:clostripain-related cysteine peptidase [Bacteroides sp.]